MIRILVVDDHELMRDGICRILSHQEYIEIVGDAGCGRDAIDKCRNLKPDIVLLDFSLPDMDGFAVLQQITFHSPDVKVLFVTMHDNEEYANRLIKLGAKGFIIKGESSKELFLAINKVMAGKIYISASIMEKMALGKIIKIDQDSLFKSLTNREIQVYIQLSNGIKTVDIARNLCISASTVNTYKQRIMKKLSLKNKTELLKLAIKLKIIEE